MSQQHSSLYPSLSGFHADIQSTTTQNNVSTTTQIEMNGIELAAINAQNNSIAAAVVATQTCITQGPTVTVVQKVDSSHFYMTRYNIHVNKIAEYIGWTGLLLGFAIMIYCKYFTFTGVQIIWISMFIAPALYLFACTSLLLGKFFKCWYLHAFYCIITSLITFYVVLVLLYFTVFSIQASINSRVPFYKNAFAIKLISISLCHLLAFSYLSFTLNAVCRAIVFSRLNVTQVSKNCSNVVIRNNETKF